MTCTAPRPVGILMLDTRFPRVVGDIGNPASFAFPVVYRRVERATARRVVHGLEVRGPDTGLVEAFIVAGKALVSEGCGAITTSCGFMIRHQKALAQALPVPVATSALLLIPSLMAMGLRPGVITASEASLGPAHLAAAGAPTDLAVAGLDPEGSLYRTIFEDRETLDGQAAEAETLAAARRVAAKGTSAILFECTNLPPYANAVRRATGLPVWSALDLVRMLAYSGGATDSGTDR